MVGVLALVVRMVPVLLGGGLTSFGRYDDGVYYAAADALTFGRVPYRDFVLLHPPGIALVLAPFALLGRLTTDPIGMGSARAAFMAIGAGNAMLVAGLCRRWGRRAAIVGGVLYACWGSAVYAEQSTMLEPLGNTALLIALLLLIHPTRGGSARAELLAGGALGLAATLKIWCIAPWAALVIWPLLQRRWATSARLAGAGAAAASLVLVPFFVLAPGSMFRMVVLDQLGRHTSGPPRLARIGHVFGIGRELTSHQPGLTQLTAVAVLAVVVSAAFCWSDRSARPIVLVLGVNLAVLLASPTFFKHYASLAAAPAAVVVGIGFSLLLQRFRVAALAPATVGVIVFCAALTAVAPVGKHLPESFTGLAPSGCVASDDPTVLVQMDRLSSDLRTGCVVPVDVSGITYDTLNQVGSTRRHNQSWQHFLQSYLTTGRSFVVARQSADHLSAAVAKELTTRPTLAAGGGMALRRGGT
jgi:alpha-1,2-mannosyltransferase